MGCRGLLCSCCCCRKSSVSCVEGLCPVLLGCVGGVWVGVISAGFGMRVVLGVVLWGESWFPRVDVGCLCRVCSPLLF